MQLQVTMATKLRLLIFFFMKKPSVFAICKNTFSKWKVGGRMAWRRVLSSWMNVGEVVLGDKRASSFFLLLYIVSIF
jgi:hypothetical protein